jgi:type IV pilus assembly protein PilE
MIVVTIVAILAGIAYPSYTNHVINTRRATVQGFMMQAAAQQEKFFTRCGYYASSFSAAPGVNNCGAAVGSGVLGMATAPDDVAGYYLLTIDGVNAAGTTYRIVATPQGAQATGDTDCATVMYNSANVKEKTGSGLLDRCWRK